MAEKGAHLTLTTQIRPSLFDFIAQDSLNDLLYPAARKIVTALSTNYVSFRQISKWFDEFFLASHFLLQLHYLKKYGATFSESFYGLRRTPLSGGKVLTKKELALSLLVVTVLPYLRTKLNEAAERMHFDESNITSKKRRLFMESVIKGNSTIEISLRIINFVQHLRYLSGKSDVNAPSLWAARVKLEYADDNTFDEPFNLRNFLPQLLRKSLEVSAFFLQFYQWWQMENVGSLGTLPVPPPPEITKQGQQLNNMCPICRKKRKVDTALSVSGYVFCFKCIHAHLEECNYCPVTNIPATVDNLIRIYPPQ